MIKVQHTITRSLVPDKKSMYHDVLVTTAELMLVECGFDDGLLYRYLSDPIQLSDFCYGAGRVYFKPILISRTEKVVHKGESFYNIKTKRIFKQDMFTELTLGETELKILALPEMFATKHLQQIISGVLRLRCGLLVECGEEQVDSWLESAPELIKQGKGPEDCYVKIIKLNPYITIYPTKEKLYTKSDVKQLILSALSQYKMCIDTNTLWEKWDTDEWFEKNVV